MKSLKIENLGAYCDAREQIFLQKILLHVQTRVAEKRERFRGLVDSWYAFYMREGFVKTTGSVQWFNFKDLAQKRHHPAIWKMHFISDKAKQVLISGGSDRLIKDHAVPVKILLQELSALKPITTADVKAFLLNRYRLGIITKCEDDQLCGPLKSGFLPSSLEFDCFARYRVVGICV